MTILLETSFPNALEALVDRFSGPAWAGALIDAWVFEDFPARHAAEVALATAGVSARIRSAYKPLLHAFLDEFDLAGVTAIDIATPAHPAGSARRFALEAYPIAGLVRVPVRFAPGTARLDYAVTLHHPDGDRHHTVFAPNSLRPNGTLSSTGWLRISRSGVRFEDRALATEFQSAFDAAMDAIAAHPWPASQPIFETLEITVATAGIERRIPWHDECISTREALHEDFYFSLLEFFQAHAGLPPGDRSLQPGQIIPDISPGAGATTVRVSLQPAKIDPFPTEARPALATADRPLRPGEIAAEMAALGGAPFTVPSTQGRPILGTYFAGSGRGFLLSGGQHANETSGVVGALRAAHDLKAMPNINFALIAQENVDGYALHQRLIKTAPHHMHHAARYTALGDDIEARTKPPLLERDLREHAFMLTNAGLHLNLHGYPAHEWTRPQAGYLPRGFELWSIPKGFFLILRHHPGHGAKALSFLEALTARVIATPGLRDFNEGQLAVWRAHSGEVPFPVLNAIPCMITESDRGTVPFTLITEYPDETIYDAPFRLAHETQYATVIAAVDLYLGGGL
jgi:hypothetical protein